MPWCIGHVNSWLVWAAIIGGCIGWAFLSAVMYGVLRHDTWRLGWDFSLDHDRDRCVVSWCESCRRYDNGSLGIVAMSALFPFTLVAGIVHAAVMLGVAVGRGPTRRGRVPEARVVKK